MSPELSDLIARKLHAQRIVHQLVGFAELVFEISLLACIGHFPPEMTLQICLSVKDPATALNLTIDGVGDALEARTKGVTLLMHFQIILLDRGHFAETAVIRLNSGM